jgi:hypothetical protein
MSSDGRSPPRAGFGVAGSAGLVRNGDGWRLGADRRGDADARLGCGTTNGVEVILRLSGFAAAIRIPCAKGQSRASSNRFRRRSRVKTSEPKSSRRTGAHGAP